MLIFKSILESNLHSILSIYEPFQLLFHSNCSKLQSFPNSWFEEAKYYFAGQNTYQIFGRLVETSMNPFHHAIDQCYSEIPNDVQLYHHFQYYLVDHLPNWCIQMIFHYVAISKFLPRFGEVMICYKIQ